jgi:hypothetical protein
MWRENDKLEWADDYGSFFFLGVNIFFDENKSRKIFSNFLK